ncbi:TATA box-binding protein-associated factor RNA polymerase I subunit A-like isoform X1 [Argopecten irradians]|uniref:TATA box-binding protein-associated factor RNA polymerase I subunit A-like isoform X1 n=1 Tax=Argopecten irradians TaxID=31199 RepID=UPI0037150C38
MAHPNEENTVVNDDDLMRDVCELLIGDSETLGDQTKSSATEWFRNWSEAIQHQKDQSSLLHPSLVTVLRDYLLTHDWTSSLSVIQILGNDPTHSATTLWKVGMEIMYHDPESNKGIIEHYVRKLKRKSELDFKEVMLEFVMYLLHMDEVDEARQALLDMPKVRGARKLDQKNHSHYQALVLQAYQGLLYYSRWKLERLQPSSTTTQMEGLDDCFGNLYYSETLQDTAERACSCFNQLYDHLGVWDIFITKHVQILEHHYRLDEAKTILEKYRDKNQENPNSHKYLYSFCVKHRLVNREETTQILKVLAECIPSDQLVMDLCDMLIEDRSLPDLLFYIFGMKDYQCWQTNIRSWIILSVALQLAMTSGNQDLIQSHWKPRESWWAKYHFNYTGTVKEVSQVQGEITPEESSTKELWLHRACCAAILCGTETNFVHTIRTTLEKEQQEVLDKVICKIKNTSGVT